MKRIIILITGIILSISAAFTMANDVDTDMDGLSNAQEASLGTDPNNPDTDADSFLDGEEVFNLYQYVE